MGAGRKQIKEKYLIIIIIINRLEEATLSVDAARYVFSFSVFYFWFCFVVSTVFFCMLLLLRLRVWFIQSQRH